MSNFFLESKNLNHRGPDFNRGFEKNGWFFDHFRLSIRDLSDVSNQPYTKPGFDEILVYNGEIYNVAFLIEKHLKEVELVTSSDTEVLYELLRIYGVDILRDIDGMFAFAFSDGENLIIARDRLGIKPLIICEIGSRLIFTSELSVILDNVRPIVNVSLIPEFIKYKYVGPQTTIYEGIRRLEPGTYEIFRNGKLVCKKKFWNLLSFESDGTYSINDADELKTGIKNAVYSQLISDVPVGVQLSGGIDSTLIRDAVPNNVESYSSVFENNYSHDESKFIEECSSKNNSKVNWVTFNEKYFQNNLLDLLKKSGGVNHPHTLAIQQISSAAKQNVKVLLSGEGADEFFMGYERYRNVLSVSNIVTNAEFYCDIELNKYFNLSEKDIENSKSSRNKALQETEEKNLLNRLRILEIQFHLQNLLERYDIATMKHSIEGRVPFLSNELIEFALSRDAKSFIDGDVLKSPLKSILSDSYPEEYVYRSKVGYRVPINDWLFSSWFYDMIIPCLEKELVVKFVRANVLMAIKEKRITDLNILGKLYWTILNLACL